ncbi:phage repressor protein [Leifsonia xyli subsp. cynodontis DSM 46306]|uniref:HTH cro/C1-type domain-containing protein n=1 Tax=Leifsonia xyli subsp. cynodontis DSM 46306 TaxID=1389489 RepID=U3PBW7_LEIXC|nr:transcriptional regulator [Leifsonia xyli]AGW40993.1 phage repressor protein [Leifsonia xyli subsp. cynodontis DSM 46306]
MVDIMDNRQRADEFAYYVALELKGKITSHGKTAKATAEAIRRPTATMNRWLNGKLPLPLSVLCEACEFLEIDPTSVVQNAYDRLAIRRGERNGKQYDEDSKLIALEEQQELENLKPSVW